jgi:hypothetical protein
MEVQEEPSFQPSQSQIGEHLRFVDAKQAIDALDFNDQGALDDQVEAVPAVELRALVLEWHRSLAFIPQAHACKLVGYAVLVGRLEKPGPEVSVDFDTCADHGLRKILEPSRLPVFLSHTPFIGHESREVASHGI